MLPDTEKLTSPQSVIALAVLAIVVGVLAIVAYRGNDELLGNVVAFILGGGLSSVTQFYFGSAKGSQAKDQTIAQLATPSPPVAPPVVSEK